MKSITFKEHLKDNGDTLVEGICDGESCYILVPKADSWEPGTDAKTRARFVDDPLKVATDGEIRMRQIEVARKAIERTFKEFAKKASA